MAATSNTLEAIVAAASACFRKFSIRKTTVEDICRTAGISRPTFYRFFSNKNELLIHLALRETHRINEAIGLDLDADTDVEAALVDGMCLALEQGRESEVIDFLVSGENVEYTLERVFRAADTLPHYEGWRRLLSHASEQGRLREGLDIEDAIRWLSLQRLLLLIYARPTRSSGEELRHLVRSYIVPGLLKPAAPSPAGSRGGRAG